MHSDAQNLSTRLFKALKSPATPRIAALGVVAMVAVLMGPPGLAVGPTQSHTNTPALPTGAAMEARAVLSTIPLSTDIIHVFSTLTPDHASYPQRVVGPLRFPAGAIDVPWLSAPAADAISRRATSLNFERGNTISTPRDRNLPQVFRTGATNRAASPSSGTLNNLRSVILFDPAASHLGGEAMDMLDDMAQGLSGNASRIQLLAYGGGNAERSHTVRRLALRRALAVRNHLMTHGISQDRITVRAMGGASDGGPADRVDLIYPSE